MDPAIIAASQARFRSMDSVGQARMVQLHDGSAESLIGGPNLWAGIGLVRAGAATALVGSYKKSLSASRSTTRWASTSSSSPATPTPRGGVPRRRAGAAPIKRFGHRFLAE